MPNRQTVGELFPQPKAENSGGSEDVIEADGNDSEDDDDFGEEAAYIRKVRSDNINERYENQRLDLRSSSTNLSSLNEFIKPHLHSGSIIPLASAFKRALRYNPARNITEHSRRFICLLKSKESSKTFFNTEENRGLSVRKTRSFKKQLQITIGTMKSYFF
ncbi:hypothetical protein PPACK8108_LOCUS26569 [Phakopsora pachyrhizi]|uniref:Uncharacterized protein n=1 Tax=Phakopsora pachyrhizi TaxID=170000 RepID=A0AAV0BUA2_PHAPC|nr:hypothetical protein PPACK8108_LOCUS26569 [Phakopsora pachyrhizi]